MLFGDRFAAVLKQFGCLVNVPGQVRCKASHVTQKHPAYALAKLHIASLFRFQCGLVAGLTLGGKQQISVVNESGLYALVLRSRKPEAKKFTKWVTSEVAAARESALQYMNAFRQATKTGQPGPRMEDIPQHLLEGIVSEALMRSRFLAGFDMQTGQMHVQLVPQDASVFSFQTGDYSQAVSYIPTQRLPELQDALSKRVARHLGVLAH